MRITGSVVTAIEPAMATFERERVARKQPESLDTWELTNAGSGIFTSLKLTTIRLPLSFC
jgi:hypothetical protein